MRVLHCIVKQFLTTKAARGLDYQPLFRKGTSLEPKERRKSSMGSMLMIALYLILTKKKKKYIKTTKTKTNKQTNKKQTSIVFLHLLKAVVFQLITLFLATPAHSLNTMQRISVWSFKTKHFGSAIKLGILFNAIL